MTDLNLEISYYSSKVVSFLYNLYGWVLGFFIKDEGNKLNTESNDDNITTNNNNTSGFVCKISKFFKTIWNNISNIYYKWCLNILKQNEVPKHIGFIMDGNRRYARMNNIQPYVAHLRGFESLEMNLEWLLYLGVHVVTVYAFSIENFKRTESEVVAIFEVTKAKLKEFCTQGKFLSDNDIKLNLIGDLSLLPDDLVKIGNEAMESTKNNKRFILNICFSYTSRYEITNAIKNVVKEVEEGKINSDEITEETIESHLLTKDCPPVDILVRTSNETRFSDFLLWQICDDTQIHFIDVYWPVFNFWNMLPVILSYQRKRLYHNKKDEKKTQ
ncbi:Di-trans-poly-cis-decaprenylcistransferase [Neocallimastix lanati (nom. inval.)]|uniref:Alkyl transferase n=1 Tax=Neocallimastix californiae TaxID=1754190 RepID=A0A1Y2DB55_9FUNG|nr:Di-trans-poly-cis-decaprenylcistransferase [Neocallimastix sp. JGI-2020a]ORY56488.1 Di-trans-poly-cis-decaprenylcistransferase [Neocallimastix californiae]|eukprot:ORY56488.1 Di-trans-poly-cis-decaprenylcistransferase [Neocallimastix californiae]